MKKKLGLLAAAVVLSVFVFFLLKKKEAFNGKTRINHVALHVYNLRKSTVFYRTIIGLDSIADPFKDGKHTWLDMGYKSQLHLIAGADPSFPKNKTHHLCFSIASMDTFIKALRKQDIPFENWAGEAGKVTRRNDGVQQIWLQDPDGYWLEINDAHE